MTARACCRIPSIRSRARRACRSCARRTSPGPEDEPEVPQKPKRRGRVVRKIVKYFLFLVLAVAIVAAGGIGYLTVTEYRPAYAEDAQRGNVLREGKLTGGQTVRVLTLNTGYGGLDAGEDFFMDGGEGVRPSDAETVRQNMLGIEDLIRGADADFVMLQEVDTDSKRSYGYDQWRQYEFDLADYESRFALNYSCDYVPYPVTEPIGRVHSGVATYSRYDITAATRYRLPCPFSWPVRIANLKRCLLVTRIPIDGSEQELVLVNLHLEAYDDGEGKEAQTAMLLQLLQDEYAKGNYVIAGGDFNQSFPDGTDRYPIASGRGLDARHARRPARGLAVCLGQRCADLPPAEPALQRRKLRHTVLCHRRLYPQPECRAGQRPHAGCRVRGDGSQPRRARGAARQLISRHFDEKWRTCENYFGYFHSLFTISRRRYDIIFVQRRGTPRSAQAAGDAAEISADKPTPTACFIWFPSCKAVAQGTGHGPFHMIGKSL